MSWTRWLGGAALLAALGVGAWQGAEWLGVGRAAAPPAANRAASTPTPAPAPSPVAVEQVTALQKGETPMADRVAVVGFLNKRNGDSRNLTMKPGQAIRIGNAIIRLRACETTAPWEQDQLTGAFLQLDVQGTDNAWRRVFSGWVYKDRPSLNVVQHPVYDVWPKSCTMSFPATGPDTVTFSSAPSGGGDERGTRRRSSAPQSPSTEGAPVASPPAVVPSAAPSNAL